MRSGKSKSILPAPRAPSLLDASSVGITAQNRLEACNGEGVVHGVFDGAINVLLPEGLISLVPETGERGPLNVKLRLPAALPRISALGAAVGDRVRVVDSTIVLNDRYLVSFGSARIYSPSLKLDVPLLAGDELDANLEVMRRTAALNGNRAGLGELLAMVGPSPTREARTLNIFASSAVPRIVRLESAFRAGDKNALMLAVSELVGLGPGLTPSSDDMLAGLVILCMLYAENSGSHRNALSLIANLAAGLSRGKTTLLSEEFLGQAALGRCNERVMSLCAALLTGGQDSVEFQTRRVLAIGETSGTDTVMGVFLGTRLCTQRPSGLTRGRTR